MRNFKTQKRSWRRTLESTPALVLLFLLTIFFVWNIFSFFGKARKTAESKKLAEEKVLELQKQKSDLSSEIGRLGTEAGVEADIREKFGLAKAGEGVIVIVDQKGASAPASLPAQSGWNFWNFLKNLFK